MTNTAPRLYPHPGGKPKRDYPGRKRANWLDDEDDDGGFTIDVYLSGSPSMETMVDPGVMRHWKAIVEFFQCERCPFSLWRRKHGIKVRLHNGHSMPSAVLCKGLEPPLKNIAFLPNDEATETTFHDACEPSSWALVTSLELPLPIKSCADADALAAAEIGASPSPKRLQVCRSSHLPRPCLLFQLLVSTPPTSLAERVRGDGL